MWSIFRLALLFWAGKLLSWLLYTITWWNSSTREEIQQKGYGATLQQVHSQGTMARLLGRPFLWPLHVLCSLALLGSSWNHNSDRVTFARLMSGAWAILLCAKCTLRFALPDGATFLIADRILCVGLSALTWLHPVFLYWSLLACCSLQYVVASWPLSPPYSSYLGFEFIRYNLSMVCAAQIFIGVLCWLGGGGSRQAHEWMQLIPLLILTAQGDYYFKQGLGKARLGDPSGAVRLFQPSHTWLRWVLENRMECLFVNSFLRGWGARLGVLNKARVLTIANILARFRVPLCAGGFLAEVLCLFLSTHILVASALYALLLGLHIGVLAMTGLFVWENVCNHAVMLAVLLGVAGDVAHPFPDRYTPLDLLATSLLCILLSERWLCFARFHKQAMVRLLLLDPSELLMCWWDSPYMRMFTYRVQCGDGSKFDFPVTLFSPYDTAITDIHTHLMYLHLHSGLDRQRTEDETVVHSGVWGVLNFQQERNRLYEQMDKKAEVRDLSFLVPSSKRTEPWVVTETDTQHPAFPLLRFFSAMNHLSTRSRDTHKWHCLWYPTIMRWPHFPGEDLVPDVSPVASQRLPLFAVRAHSTSAASVVTVEMRRLKTFYTGDDIVVLEEADVGRIIIPSHLTPIPCRTSAASDELPPMMTPSKGSLTAMHQSALQDLSLHRHLSRGVASL